MSTVPDTIHVLHVDDEPEFADLAATFIERGDERFAVETATSADEGLDRLRDNGFDCIVSDYDMPGQNGIEFLETVCETHPDLPFILYTDKGSEKVASDALSAGATDYLQKETGTGQYELLANRIENAVSQARSQQAERHLGELAANTTQILYVFTRDWSELEFINSAYEDILGQSVEALQDDPSDFLAGVHPDDRDRVREDMDDISGGETVELEYRVNPNENYGRWVRVRGTPIQDESGTVTRVAGFATDITEQKRQQRNLKKYRQLVDSLPNPVAVYDPEGNYELVNQALADLRDATSKDLIGDPSPHIQRIRDEHEDDPFATLLDGDRDVIRGEYTAEFADGGQRTFEYLLTPLDVGEDTRSVVASTRDITERKERERELQRERDRLDEFASVVSHDLRNPLRLAEGRLELAREDCDSEHLGVLDDALARMDRIIEDVLWLAREGRQVGSTEPIALHDAVGAAWEVVAHAGAGADLRCGADDRPLPTIEADDDRLQQLFENLLSNAIEHGGPDVTVTVGRLDDGFCVEDDGPGIPRDDREEVFTAGYTTAEEGTGFGLRIVKQVADAHGWDISVTDGAAGGARFEITGVGFVGE